MHIQLYLTVGLLTLVPGIVQATDEKRPIYRYISSGNKLSNIRWSRSVPGMIRALINSAVEVPTKRQKYRKFIKQGSKLDAVADFEKLQPTNTQKQLYSTDAFVGDVEVKLRFRDSVHNRRPSIEIIDPSGARPVKILYIKDTLRLP